MCNSFIAGDLYYQFGGKQGRAECTYNVTDGVLRVRRLHNSLPDYFIYSLYQSECKLLGLVVPA